jgi:hypothetical protein
MISGWCGSLSVCDVKRFLGIYKDYNIATAVSKKKPRMFQTLHTERSTTQLCLKHLWGCIIVTKLSDFIFNILSCVWGSVMNNGFFGLDDWIYWCCYYNYTKLQSLITAHNWWLPKAHSISFLDYENLPFHCGWLVNFLRLTNSSLVRI